MRSGLVNILAEGCCKFLSTCLLEAATLPSSLQSFSASMLNWSDIEKILLTHQGSSCLRVLRLGCDNLSKCSSQKSEALLTFFDRPPPSLCDLGLIGCGMQESTVCELLRECIENFPHLEKLDLTGSTVRTRSSALQSAVKESGRRTGPHLHIRLSVEGIQQACSTQGPRFSAAFIPIHS